ncbi:MAG: nuclear transport factor 2 family protein [Pseudonocardia sp.]
MSTLLVFEKLAESVAARDPGAAAALFSADAFFSIPGPQYLPFNGRRRGRAEIATFFHELWDNLVDSAVEVREIVARDEHVIVFGAVSHTARPTGRRFPNEFCWHLRVEAEQIVSLQVYDDTYAVAEAFGSGPAAPVAGRRS